MEDGFQEGAVAFAGLFALDLINPPGRPGQHGWIYIAEVPFVGRNLSVRMLIPLANYGIDLALGEVRIDQGEGNTMKSQVPRGIPGEFPIVGHGHDALIVEVAPFGVAPIQTRGWGWGICRIAGKPLPYNIVIELFAPK